MRAFILLLLTGTTLLASQPRQVVPTPLEVFWALVSGDSLKAVAAELLLLEDWDDAHASILVELIRYVPGAENRQRIFSVLERGTGQKLGRDLDGWWAWIWRTNPGTHPDYAAFKAELYASIDPSFEDYFDESPACEHPARRDSLGRRRSGRDSAPRPSEDDRRRGGRLSG